jgi:anti-sigma-K factor RskA
MTHEELVELIPLAAIEALPAGEAREVRRHCAGHPPCAQILADYERVAAELGAGVPMQPLPPQLAERLRSRVGSGRRFALPFAFPAGFSPGLAAAALLLLVLASLALWRFVVSSTDPDAAEVTRLQQTSGAINVAITGTDQAPGASGRVLADPQATVGYLVVNKMKSLQPGQVYQVWLIRYNMRESGGTFTVDPAGSALVRLSAPQAFSRYTDLGVTVEPAGGSPAPTSPRVIGGALPH